MVGIVGAEYLTSLVPPGTHDWNKFITPPELKAALEAHDIRECSTAGVFYNPMTSNASLVADTSINYIMSGIKTKLEQ